MVTAWHFVRSMSSTSGTALTSELRCPLRERSGANLATMFTTSNRSNLQPFRGGFSNRYGRIQCWYHVWQRLLSGRELLLGLSSAWQTAWNFHMFPPLSVPGTKADEYARDEPHGRSAYAEKTTFFCQLLSQLRTKVTMKVFLPFFCAVLLVLNMIFLGPWVQHCCIPFQWFFSSGFHGQVLLHHGEKWSSRPWAAWLQLHRQWDDVTLTGEKVKRGEFDSTVGDRTHMDLRCFKHQYRWYRTKFWRYRPAPGLAPQFGDDCWRC